MSDAPVVVVGAGLAGARTCSELRSQGFNGRLVMVGTVCAIDKTMSRTERSTRITITDDQLELIS